MGRPHEAQPEAPEGPEDQQDRVGHLKKASELGEQRRGGEKEDEGLDLRDSISCT